uniref:serine/arginine-rich splicing factor 3-like n=1 Tax=Styela clava TaxID=7725 RepID=UPI00193A4F13|nr:serine/arginine-rich splicing factor 3-like [Styela clava]
MSYKDRRPSAPLDCKVYVGNLGDGASRSELEIEFGHFGRLVSVWVARKPPGFAYVEFEDPRDAKDAVRSLDGTTLCGRRAKVELSHGQKRNRNFRPSYSDRPPRRDMSEVRCYTCNQTGHIARNCREGGKSRSRSPRRRYSRSRSHSPSRSRSPSPKYSRSRSRTPEDKRQSRSRSRSRSRS